MYVNVITYIMCVDRSGISLIEITFADSISLTNRCIHPSQFALLIDRSIRNALRNVQSIHHISLCSLINRFAMLSECPIHPSITMLSECPINPSQCSTFIDQSIDSQRSRNLQSIAMAFWVLIDHDAQCVIVDQLLSTNLNCSHQSIHPSQCSLFIYRSTRNALRMSINRDALYVLINHDVQTTIVNRSLFTNWKPYCYANYNFPCIQWLLYFGNHHTSCARVSVCVCATFWCSMIITSNRLMTLLWCSIISAWNRFMVPGSDVVDICPKVCHNLWHSQTCKIRVCPCGS